MAIHTFICDTCNIKIQDTDTKGTHKCPKCHQDMYWDIRVNQHSRGDFRHVSDSLAIHPDQTREHREKFPDVDVLPDGRIGFNSIKSYDKYLDKCGFVKCHKNEKL